VIDGDIAYEIDSREVAPSWSYGLMPMGSVRPNEKPKPGQFTNAPLAYELNGGLVAWAYALTRDTPIPDSAELAAHRARYTGSPNARRPPFVLVGESFGSNRYWYGQVMTRWAEDWTKLWTDGKGVFAMTDMEDQGFAAALSRLGKMGKVDFSRVLVLRTGSDFCRQAPGADANASLHAAYPGYGAALEAAYRVGSRVVHQLAGHWDQYRDTTPSP
jgi:purine nucleoside permease